MSKCRSCGAPIEWAVTDAGKMIPLDADPVPEGNLVVEAGKSRARTVDDPGVVFWRTHFATCPNADEHRRR